MLMVSVVAQKFLVDLLKSQREGAEIRVLITDAGTSNAQFGICFCFSDSFQYSDVVVKFDLLSVRIEQRIIPFLRNSVIDVLEDKLHSRQLVFKAPYAKGFNGNSFDVISNSDDCSLEQKIKNVLEVKINPQLFFHGGSVSLVEITKDLLVVLKFSGGCNGCAMAHRTMQLGIEVVLKKIFPQLKGVCDVTEHIRGDHSYY